MGVGEAIVVSSGGSRDKISYFCVKTLSVASVDLEGAHGGLVNDLTDLVHFSCSALPVARRGLVCTCEDPAVARDGQ